MNLKLLAISFIVAILSGFVHGAIGLGYGMIAMALLTTVMPYSDSAAIVSCALLVVVGNVAWSLRKNICWKLVIGPSIAMLIGKIWGMVLLMHLKSDVLRIALGSFLILYAASQLFDKFRLKIRGTGSQGLIFCFLGGLLGGVFNVSGPAAVIYFQAVCPNDTKMYAACLNFTFFPAAIVGVILHALYGNFSLPVVYACCITVIGVLAAATAGVAIFKRINAKHMKKLTHIYIGIMGAIICMCG